MQPRIIHQAGAVRHPIARSPSLARRTSFSTADPHLDPEHPFFVTEPDEYNDSSPDTGLPGEGEVIQDDRSEGERRTEKGREQRMARIRKRLLFLHRLGSYGSKKGMRTQREPGIDPSQVDLPGLKQRLVIQAVDYDRASASYHVFNNEELIEYLKSKDEKKKKCRWIHVNGLSW